MLTIIWDNIRVIEAYHSAFKRLRLSYGHKLNIETFNNESTLKSRTKLKY